jgi:hypothetical protein
MKVLAGAVFALLIATPVLADPPADAAWSSTPAKVPGGSVERVGSPQGADRASCVDLMERAFYLNDPASPDRTLDAHREMELARDAYQDGDEDTCRRHALNALDDRA